nr:L,D-transpeptidase family protein [Granulicella aggregans]
MDLHCGRINPHEAHADLLANCEGFDPVKFVWHVSQSRSPVSEFDWLEPPSPGYQRTRLALQHYIPMLSKPEIILQRVGKAVNVGDSYAGLAALRAVLVRDGDLTPGEMVGSSLIYDESTATAVKSFQHRHGLNPDGVLTAESYRQLSVSIEDRVAQLQLTLERWRWISQAFAEPPIVVNIPEFKLRAYDSNLRVVLAMEVIVGGAYHRQTPVFQNQISSIIFRPYWNIPQDIQHREMEPAMRRDSTYLAKHDYEKVSIPGKGFRIRQRPGDRNALGLIKFSLPNRYDIYLHGTPLPKLFEKTRRDFSHGCIRLKDPAALAVWALQLNGGWSKEKVEAAMHGEQTTTVSLVNPIPVLIVYATAFAGEDNVVYFLPDIYKEDKSLAALLQAASKKRHAENVEDAGALSGAINNQVEGRNSKGSL